jgi:hypothetical protein
MDEPSLAERRREMSPIKVGSWGNDVLKRTGFLDVFRAGVKAASMFK